MFHLIEDSADDAVVILDSVFEVPKLGDPLPKYWVLVLGKIKCDIIF
jgi:hypothetical protein